MTVDLNLSFDEFKKIRNVNQKLDILYFNQQRMLCFTDQSINDISKLEIQTKWQWAVISFGALALGWIFIQLFQHLRGVS